MMRQISCGEVKKAKDNDYCQKSVCISDNCWIERPKFFNGQLLTDADLKAEQNYVIEKNKLHNRYMHGWGVACGLKVKCYPCCEGHGSSGKVLVEPGYAIDCCGNDIVVCDEQEFDVVKRINEMKQKKLAEQSPCETGAAEPVTTCSNGEEKYYLVLSYKEEDAKPATALKADDPCSIQRCVPSRTKECFELGLTKYCTLEEKPEDNFLIRVKECMDLYDETWVGLFGGPGTIGRTAEEIKNFIREYYKALTSHVHCDVLDQLEEIESTKSSEITLNGNQAILLQYSLKPGTIETSARDFLNADPFNLGISDTANVSRRDDLNWDIEDGIKYLQIKFHTDSNGNIVGGEIISNNESLIQLIDISVQLLLDCICQTLLIPCPQCDENDVVILATITVKNNKIHQICNLSRRFLITHQSLGYWFTHIFYFIFKGGSSEFHQQLGVPINTFSELVEYLCCGLKISDKDIYVKLFEFFKSPIDTFIMIGRKLRNLLSDSGGLTEGTINELSLFKKSEEEVTGLKTELEKMNKKMAAMEKELKEMKKKTPGPKAAGTKKK